MVGMDTTLVGTITEPRTTAVPDTVLLDRDELAARLGVSERFVRRLVEERRIPYVKIGRFVRFDPVEIDRWLTPQRVEPRAAIAVRRRRL
jgi:excisionase family DNA binding protein